MRRELRAVLVTATLVWPMSMSACGKSDEAPPKLSRVELPAKPEPEPAAAASETGSDRSYDEAIEVDASESETETNAVPISSIEAEPTTVEWREVAGPNTELEFVYVTAGVVARSSAGVYERDKKSGELVLRPELTLPDGELVGYWPDDMWSFTQSPITPDDDGPRFEYEVMSLNRDRQWVPAPRRGEARWSAGINAVRKGWQAGLLVREGSSLQRLGSRKHAGKVGTRMGKVVVDTIETLSGQVYSISQRTNGLYVQGPCRTFDCVKDSAKKLPLGSSWSFSIQVPRQRKSLSVLATVDYEGAAVHQLLSFGFGGWKLETLPRAVEGMWPVEDGGLWLAAGDELLFRSPHAHWRKIALPEGAGKFSAALLRDGSELWISTTVAGAPKVYATAAQP